MRQQAAVDNEGRGWRMIMNSFLILAVEAVPTGYSYQARVDVSAPPSPAISHSITPAVTTAPSNPTRIRISSFGVNSTVMKLGLLRDGSLQVQPSHVLASIGALTHGNVRVALPHFVSEVEIRRFFTIIPVVIANARRQVQ